VNDKDFDKLERVKSFLGLPRFAMSTETRLLASGKAQERGLSPLQYKGLEWALVLLEKSSQEHDEEMHKRISEASRSYRQGVQEIREILSWMDTALHKGGSR